MMMKRVLEREKELEIGKVMGVAEEGNVGKV